MTPAPTPQQDDEPRNICPIWGSVIRERSADYDARIKAMPIGELVAEMERLAGETL